MEFYAFVQLSNYARLRIFILCKMHICALTVFVCELARNQTWNSTPTVHPSNQGCLQIHIMVFRISLMCVLLFVGSAFTVNTFVGYKSFGSKAAEQEKIKTLNPSSLLEPAENKLYTSGYIRIDTSNNVDGTWIHAQVVPIGVCFREGKNGGSAKVPLIAQNFSHMLGITYIYDGPDCTGTFSSVTYSLPSEETINNFLNIVTHVPDLETALKIRPVSSDGLIISSFYSSDGCTGEVAQYDLFTTGNNTLYDGNITGRGTFQCDNTAEMMILTLFRAYEAEDDDDDTINLSATNATHDTVPTVSEPEISKHPLKCSEVWAVGEDSPFFQTVRCVKNTIVV